MTAQETFVDRMERFLAIWGPAGGDMRRSDLASLIAVVRAAEWIVNVHGDSVPCGSALWEDIQALRTALTGATTP